MPEEGSYVLHIAVGSLSVYDTTIRGCGVVDTIYQVVNSTCESIHMGPFFILATGKRAYSSHNVVVVVAYSSHNRSDLYPVPFSFLLFKAKKRISVVTS